jgi:hypothetical protein
MTSGPMDTGNAIDYLWAKYQVDVTAAEHLLAAAVEGETGMASFPREGAKTIWATWMTTQGGKFIIETEWP